MKQSCSGARERVLKAILCEETDRPPRGELCIIDSVIRSTLGCRTAGFEEYYEFVSLMGLDIFVASPLWRDEENLLDPGAHTWPELEKWSCHTPIFTFAIIDGAFETGLSAYGGFDILTLPRRSPADFSDFLSRVELRNLTMIKKAADCGADGILLADDIAYNKGLMIPPDDFRGLFLPSIMRQAEEIRKTGLPVFFHSDGNYSAIIPDLIGAGIQGIQCIDSSCGMDIWAMHREYGGLISLWGHIGEADTRLAHDVAFLAEFCSPLQDHALRRGIILGTSSGLHDGLDMDGLKLIYNAAEK